MKSAKVNLMLTYLAFNDVFVRYPTFIFIYMIYIDYIKYMGTSIIKIIYSWVMGVNFVFFVNKHETLGESLSSESQN
jgi:hypothetical protein